MAPRPHHACWRRLDHPGHDAASLVPRGGEWTIRGKAVFDYDGAPCALAYTVDVDDAWHTRAGVVDGWIGDREISIRLTADGAGRWWRDGVECSSVAGCLDADYGFSPATNLLPIRRIAPPIGAAVPVRAVWLRFPELTLEPLDQVYRRVSERAWVYESAGGAFRADLVVDEAGMVVRYGDIWVAEAGERTASDR